MDRRVPWYGPTAPSAPVGAVAKFQHVDAIMDDSGAATNNEDFLSSIDEFYAAEGYRKPDELLNHLDGFTMLSMQNHEPESLEAPAWWHDKKFIPW